MEKPKIYVKSNDSELSEKVIRILENENWILKNTMKSEMLDYQGYLIFDDKIVSPLCQEMHYPDYFEIYATEFIKIYNEE